MQPYLSRPHVFLQALRGIGVSVMYSAITTCASVVTLVFAQLAPIQKMGLIIFFALLLSILISLIPYPAMLASWGPLGYKRTLKRMLVCMLGAGVVIALAVFALWIAHLAGVTIIGPTGSPMF